MSGLARPRGAVFEDDWGWWMRPPVNEMPGTVVTHILLARATGADIYLTEADVYSTGIRFAIVALIAADGDEEVSLLEPDGDTVHADFVLSVEYADGRRASTDDPGDPDASSPPSPIALSDIRYGGGPPRATGNYFLWPLPPSGTVTFCCSWPRMHLHAAKHRVDADVFLDAAADCERLWLPV
jgi:hypothetical protein